MKTFLIQTTTNDKWELCVSSFIVNDIDEDNAKKQVENYLIQNNTTQSIINVKEIITNKLNCIIIQEAIVE
jgi:hypothetical protein